MGGLDHYETVSSPEIGERAVAVQRGEIVRYSVAVRESMMGRSRPVMGGETRICRSTARSGAYSTTGLTETTGVGASCLRP